MLIYNTDSSFVGIEKFKLTHSHQIDEFEEWAAQNDWEKFHYNHYDWWVFPVDRRSSYGLMWVVYSGEVAILQSDPQFMQKYCRGVCLVSASLGWDLDACGFILNASIGQSWHNWPIRLYKAAQSVKLFGMDLYFESLKAYANYLIQKGESFVYNNRDLTEIFR
jgi:hypothetical protein